MLDALLDSRSMGVMKQGRQTDGSARGEKYTLNVKKALGGPAHLASLPLVDEPACRDARSLLGSPPGALSRKMSTLARGDTGPELALRRAMFRLGLRYRVQLPVPGNNRRGSMSPSRARRSPCSSTAASGTAARCTGPDPRPTREWWDWKIQRNKDRDADTNRLLAEHGWRVVRVWEHEKPAEAVERAKAPRRD